MKCFGWLTLVVASVLLASCNCVKEGVIVSKRVRKGMPNIYADGFFRCYYEPDVYWVEVEGRNQHGKVVRKSVILFRNDWSLINVGDHWHRGQPVAQAKTGFDK